jgi:error-prone DNA polymerase
LVIQIAIVRPGPIQGDMVHPYLLRRMGKEQVVYHSEAIKTVLQRTLGVPIFQEQVMQLAIVAAGFTPGEADRLRRAMAAWKRRGGLEQFETKLMQGMQQRGYPEQFARQLFNQIKGFGDYGFPESHSASFALLAYASSWLKYYHPAAFTCALINSQPMGFYAVSQLAQDAVRHGVRILAVDVNQSEYDCHLPQISHKSIKQADCLRLGLRLIKGLSEKAARRLISERKHGLYKTVQDLASRTGMHKGDLEALAAAGSLAALVGNRHQAYWQVGGVEESTPIFSQPEFNEALPMLPKPSEGASIIADYAQLGLTLERHPLALLRPRLDSYRVLCAEKLWDKANDSWVRVAGLVVCRQRPATAKNVVFVTLEDETGQSNIIVWPNLAEEQHKVLLKASLMIVHGRIQQNDGVLHVIAKRMEDWSAQLNHLDVSRNFR